MATRITCYGGVAKIGGNKILLEDAERRVFFDFGKSFGRYSAYFDGIFIRGRAAKTCLGFNSSKRSLAWSRWAGDE